jgi:regulator of protease activity HflC (stomatin/prohibitin superfamily)
MRELLSQGIPRPTDGNAPPAPAGAGPRLGRIGLGLLVVLLLVGLAGSVRVVNAGYVGVLTTFGRVHDAPLQPGLHVVNPVSQRVVPVDVRVLPHPFKEIDAASREYQTVTLTGNLNYQIDPARAPELYRTVGLDFADKVLDAALSDIVKEVVPRYGVGEILPRRDEIRAQAKRMLGENLARYGIVVNDVYISNISFSPEYQAAIERKQTAQQQAEAERQILEQKRVQAEQAVVDARGQADARVASAEGEARANRAITESLSPQLVEYLRWTRWDGKLPQVLGGDNQTLISVPLTEARATPTAAPTPPAQAPASPTPAR